MKHGRLGVRGRAKVANVFVSYAANDRDRVARLVEALQATGLSVWWDRGIDVGSTFDREIERELDGAGCVVVAWSRASVDSEWVRNEAFEAQSRDALVPILIDDVKPPLAFRRAQTARMLEWPGSVGEFDAMLRAVRSRLAKPPRPVSCSIRRLTPFQRRQRAVAPSIVVLPLSNVSPDPEQVHFVDGLTIELIHRLSSIPNLRVAGQASSFAYKNRSVSYAEIGRTLGIGHLLEGSVRRAGDRLRVTVELVSTANGFQLWSADFDRQLDDIFAIQREISDAVADALSIKLRGDSLELLGSTHNASAHAHYLRGNALFWQHTPETTERAIAELEEAVAIDPGFARAWAALAPAYGGRARRLEHTEQSLRDMSKAVDRALEIEPLLWLAHAQKGWYLLSRRQFVAADAAMKEAPRLRRGQESIVGPEIMNYLKQIGRWTEQLEEGDTSNPWTRVSAPITTPSTSSTARRRRITHSRSSRAYLSSLIANTSACSRWISRVPKRRTASWRGSRRRRSEAPGSGHPIRCWRACGNASPRAMRSAATSRTAQ